VRFTAFSSTTFFAEQRHIARYLGVGAAAAVVDISLLMLFANCLGLPYLRVAAGTFVLATLVNYWLSVRFVFVSGKRFTRRWEVVMVFVVSAIGLGLNQVILFVCVDGRGMGLLAAKLIATGIVFFWNYFGRRVFVFGAVHH
jgi:putative flippase GtrA